MSSWPSWSPVRTQIDTQLPDQTRQNLHESAGILKNLSWVEAYSTPMMEEDLLLLARQPVKKSVPSAVRSFELTPLTSLDPSPT